MTIDQARADLRKLPDVYRDAAYPYVWRWSNVNAPTGDKLRHVYADRAGQRVRVVCRGRTMNSALVEFESGHRAVVSRNALRKVRV